MSDLNSDRRTANRNSLALSVVVKGRESEEEFWKEDTEIVTVSRIGASFNLQRECSVGRIMSMLLRMPVEYRCYDEDKNLYRIWGLVQHCSPVNQNTAFQVGVAFIGKYAPKSYFDDPLKTYRIVGMDEFGLWNVGETQAPFISRSHNRFPAAVGVRVAVLSGDGTESEVDTEAVTENISVRGASVFSTLNVETGGAVKFLCDTHNFSSLSVVRNRQKREGGRTTLHLEFTESDFPVVELKVPYEEDEELLDAAPAGEPLDEGPALDADSEETAASGADAAAVDDEVEAIESNVSDENTVEEEGEESAEESDDGVDVKETSGDSEDDDDDGDSDDSDDDDDDGDSDDSEDDDDDGDSDDSDDDDDDGDSDDSEDDDDDGDSEDSEDDDDDDDSDDSDDDDDDGDSEDSDDDDDDDDSEDSDDDDDDDDSEDSDDDDDDDDSEDSDDDNDDDPDDYFDDSEDPDKDDVEEEDEEPKP